MEIEIRTEDEDGNVHFEGTLKQNEVNFVLNVGINYLMAKGAFPFMVQDPDEPVVAVEGTGTVQ